MIRLVKTFNSFKVNILLISCLLLIQLLACREVDKTGMITFGNARFTVISNECIRMEYSENKRFINNRTLFADSRSTSFINFTVKNLKDSLIIKTSRCKLTYKPNGKPFSAENLQVIMLDSSGVIWYPGKKNISNLGGTIKTLDGVNGPTDLGEGILSHEGWSLVDDSNTPILNRDWVQERPKEQLIDWYLFTYGHDYKIALKTLSKVSGQIPIPRKYVLGSWYSRYWPYSSDDYRKIVKEYEKYDFPLDVMVLDMDWHKDGWTGWSINRKLLPDFEELMKWFKEKNIRVTLNLHPADGIQLHEDMYKSFNAAMGIDTLLKPDSIIPYDCADKKYIETLYQYAQQPLIDKGVDFWWLDWQQYDKTPSIPSLRNLPWLNRFYFNQMSLNENRGISFSRWGGWGDQKYPIHFSGDSYATWPSLEFQIPFTTTAGNVGCFFWSHDIGGHQGGLDPELSTRWVQFGSVTATLRLHSTRDKNMDKRPWLREKKYTDAMRNAYHFRDILFPYIYTSIWQSCTESVPFTEPMYIEYPKNDTAYQSSGQFFFGPNFIIAPIVTPGIGQNKLSSQKIWFPEDTWYNWFTGEKMVGQGQIVAAWADINEFPAFVRAGVLVPTQPYTQRMTSDSLKKLILYVYPGIDGKIGVSQLYEDDGITDNYKHGHYSVTNLEYTRQGNIHRIVIYPVKGSYTGQVAIRDYSIRIPSTVKGLSAKVNGQETLIKYDSIKFINTIDINQIPVKEQVEIEIEAADIDQNILILKAKEKRLLGLSKNRNEYLSGIINSLKLSEIQEFISFTKGISIFRDDENKFTIVKASNSSIEPEISIKVVDQYGKEERIPYHEKVKLENGDSKIIKITSGLDEKIGITVKRKAIIAFKMSGKEYSIERLLDQLNIGIRNWYLVGPFDFNPLKKISDYHYGPEKDKEFNFSKIYSDKSDTQLKWKKVVSQSDAIDIRKFYDVDNSIAYALTFIYSETDQPIKLIINSDDGNEIWLNGRKIHSINIMRGLLMSTDIVNTNLKKGNNMFLMKISQGSGGWAFQLKAETPNPISNSLDE